MSLPLVEELRHFPDVSQTLRAFADQPGLILLDSALQREPTGRYSFLAADPIERVIHHRVPFGVDPFAQLRPLLAKYEIESVAGMPPFQGGAAGLLSYELGGAFERVSRAAIDEFELPDLAVGIYDWVIAWDHRQHRAWIISHGLPDGNRNDRVVRAAARLKFVQERLATTAPTLDDSFSPSESLVAPDLAPQFAAPGLEGLTSNFSREQYLNRVRANDRVHSGRRYLSSQSDAAALVSPNHASNRIGPAASRRESGADGRLPLVR